MRQQITRTISVKIWADGKRRLPKDIDRHLEAGLAHAAEQASEGFVSGQIIPDDENLRGWWEVETKDE